MMRLNFVNLVLIYYPLLLVVCAKKLHFKG